jgi:protein-S-isoprenylcysteine O-methyltransferase Ste14
MAGTFLEERKLEKQYGRDYIEYKKSVPRIIPLRGLVVRLKRF